MTTSINNQTKTRRSVFGWPLMLLFVALTATNCQSLMKNGLFYDGADSVDAIPVDLFAPIRALVADDEELCPPGFKNTVPVPGKEKLTPENQEGPVTKTSPATGENGAANQQAAVNCQKIKSTG